MITRVNGVFCDLDGTLVETTQANFAAYRAALATVGVDFTWDSFLGTWGADSREFLPKVAPTLSSREIDHVRSVKARLYPDFLAETTLNHPLLRVLQTWKPTAQVLLVTTAKRANVSAVLAHHGLEDLFAAVVTGEDTERSKPHPAPYLRALEITGLDATECIAFEDSAAGIASARGAGVDVVRVGWPDAA